MRGHLNESYVSEQQYIWFISHCWAKVLVKWFAKSVKDREVLGSYPATFNFLKTVTIFLCKATRENNVGNNLPKLSYFRKPELAWSCIKKTTDQCFEHYKLKNTG